MHPRSTRVSALLTGVCLTLAASSALAQQEPSSVWSGEDSWDVPGEYVVDFDDDVATSTITETLSAMGLSSRPSALVEDTGVQIVKVPSRGLVAGVLAKLRGDDRVEYVEPLARVRAFFVPDDPMYGKQWHMKQVGAEAAWGLSIGRGVTVAVVDTGIACENFKQFTKASDLLQTGCVGGYNFVNDTEHANDDQGHGTHVAGTVAQSTNNGVGVAGLAFGAKLMPVKVLSADGWGTTAAVADGIRWAADHGAQVINLSLGGPRNSKVLQSAVDHARSRGAVIVAAAGNSGGAVGFPGASEGVIGVSATDQKDALARFSSRGDGVDIAAPGVDVTQQTVCDRGKNRCEIYPSYNGTSMASPHVAGVAAMLVGLGVNDADAVEAILQDSAKVLDDSPAGRKKFGAGRLQADAALEGVVTAQMGARLLAVLALALLAFRWSRRRGETIAASSPGMWLSAIAVGVGPLFFAPFVLSRHELWVDVLSRPMAEWDLFVGMSLHRFLPLANAAIPLLLVAMFNSIKGAAPWLAGIALGTAGYLASVIALGQLSTPFGTMLTAFWCGINAFICVYLASLLIRKSEA
ncbi:MAG TPA: peptidase S8 [Polyangiaceae bacterium]|nr:peptidase S8 [Polyangiaceae bacterium]